MSIGQQYVTKEQRPQENTPSIHFFRKMGMLVVESSARRILMTYLDNQNFYKISPDVLFFRKKLEDFICFLAKTMAIHQNHDVLEPWDMKAALVIYFHLITSGEISNLNMDKIDASKLFILHQSALFAFYRSLLQRKIDPEGTNSIIAIQEQIGRLLDGIGELKKKHKKEILEGYINVLEIVALLQEKNNPNIVLRKNNLEKSQSFIKQLLFDKSSILNVEILYNIYRLLKNSQLLMNLCLVEIPWETVKFLKTTKYYKNDLHISKVLHRNNLNGLEHTNHLVLNFLQFLSKILALKQNRYVNQELFALIFRLFDKLIVTHSIEQIEYMQIHIFPDWQNHTEMQIQDFIFTAFKKDCTKEAKDYLLQLKSWFSHLLVKDMGRKELLLDHPKFLIQMMTAMVFLAFRNAYFNQQAKIDRIDVKMAFNQLCYLLMDAKFSYLK